MQFHTEEEEVELVGLPRATWPSSGRQCGGQAPQIKSEKGSPAGKREFSTFPITQRNYLDMIDCGRALPQFYMSS